VDRSDVEAWVERYVRAWGSNDPIEIGGLFTEGARYYTAPHREPWRGQQEIVEGWLDRKDEQGTWSFRSEVLAVAGDLGFVRGWTTSTEESDCSNLWMIRLTEDGRCSEFIEWWMEIEKK
jgi:ketosteroid isomerase-like protein